MAKRIKRKEGKRISLKACFECHAFMHNNTHHCPACNALTPAGHAAEMRKYLNDN